MNTTSKRLETLSSAERRTLLGSVLRQRVVEPKTAPASFSQERLWFLDRLQPVSALYNIPAAIRIPGPLSTAVLARCLQEIVRRHETLRTTFESVEGRPVQRISERFDVTAPVVDLQDFPAPEREAEAQRQAAVEARRPFDLQHGPLFRVSILRLGPADHVVLLTLHHIISDGWSLGVLLWELSTLYQAYTSGLASPLPDLEIQYSDFAQWQRENLQGAVLESHRRWWRKALEGAPEALELPADRRRPPVSTYRGSTELFLLPPALAEALKQLAQQESATLFMVLLAGFQTLLARYTGVFDVVVGVPIANRTRPELEGLIGFFVNTLVLRTDLCRNPSFRELLARVRESSLEAFAHQDLPFEKLVEELQPARSLNHNPLFQVMMVLQNAPGSSEAAAGMPSAWPAGTGTAKFDLTLFVTDTPQGLSCALEYATDLFDRERIVRMAGHLEALLEAVAANPECRIGDVGLFSAHERSEVLEWNWTQQCYPDRLPHEWFEAQVERTPGADALITARETWSYAELNRRANRLAHYLRRRGVGPEVLVSISIEPSSEMVLSVLAVLKAGGAYVPIDPAYPEERRRFMLEHSGCAILLTREWLEEEAEAIALESDQNPTRSAALDNLIYVIYTSGSTGQPKGVAMHARPLANLLAWQLGRPHGRTAVSTLQFASLSFDVSFQEILATLGGGGALRLLTANERRESGKLLAIVEEDGVERLFIPFVALQQLAAVEASRNGPRSTPREVITAGEQLQIGPQIARLFRRWKGCALHNQYGPTETHVATQFSLEGPPDAWMALPPIGRPIANAQAYVLDERMNLLPVGVTGELYLGGIAPARGYLHQPVWTAERFVPNPFGPTPGERLYRTGDLARFRPDGNLEFAGRRDAQVKIRGYRVEPGEIEALLAGHHDVKAAAVAAPESGARDRRLVAYIVASRPGVSTAELRDYVASRLPEHMVPSAFVILDRLPLTPSGKLDRAALPLPDGQRPGLKKEFEAPRTSLEQEVADLWSQVLEVAPIGIHDNFFELGGHSLLATRLVSRVRQAFDVDLPLERVFASATIAEMCCAIVEIQLRAYAGDQAALLAQLSAPDGERSGEHA
jgi:amino acid adenylation domain-containing protein